jgi:2-dehydropantoate 2-reductase
MAAAMLMEEICMRIAILGGGGAMGGLFGGYLARAGNDVTLIDVSKAAIGAINDHKLTIEEKDGSQPSFGVPASDDPKSVGPVDLIVNFVKCYHTEAAIKSAAPMIGADTAVLSLQNGWGNAPRIASIVGEDRVLVGLTYHSATLLAPGKVKHPGSGMTYIGVLNDKPSKRLEKVADAFRGASFDVTVSEKILDEVWKKLALNACTLPTAALLRFFAHELAAFEPAKLEMAAILREVVDVANAQGISLDYDERWNAIISLLEKAIGGKASMLQDVEARRQTEIEVINGAIVEAGKRVGIATPHNQAMVWMVQAAEQHYLKAKAN